MTKPTVKICGLQSEHIVEAINRLTVDQIGFVFAKSKRQVSAEDVRDMLSVLEKNTDGTPLTVGVFVNPTEEELKHVMRIASLDVIQLHGAEPASFCERVKDEFGVKVYKVFAERGEALEASRVEQLLAPYKTCIDALMLDTFDPIVGGGTGVTFAWDRIPPYHQWAKKHGLPLLIAGGLNAGNVGELIQKYKPDGVDVSSGVETNGHKDINKMAQFIERVKQCGESYA